MGDPTRVLQHLPQMLRVQQTRPENTTRLPEIHLNAYSFKEALSSSVGGSPEQFDRGETSRLMHPGIPVPGYATSGGGLRDATARSAMHPSRRQRLLVRD